MRRIAAALFLSLVCCRGAAPQNPQDQDIARLVDSLRPAVERATGLVFRRPVRSAMKSREEVHAYLLDKLRQEFPPERQEGVEAVYRLLGLMPDTLNLRDLLLDLYSEQVAGFEARTTISRKDFGLNWNVALETGGVLVSDSVKIEIHAEANK